ncbi:hypothetical protein RHMOL_Rhmol10G0037700 [Rhododendron molle]|uniref:Uncharacterized protein n=1 Tax=Rhododendron molle TaxID=49168 RepID=A0ACC0M0C7_RHOML|nr:hypothetical protein RHMOL_Rhmol10G0037700 [Rhododendron molle]
MNTSNAMTCSGGLMTCVLHLVLVFGCAILLPPVFSDDDTICLQGVKAAVANPLALKSWNFSDNTDWFISNKFVGVSFWNDQENRLIGLNLSDMSLGGRIPAALKYCYSLQSLDLSGNNLTGPIPDDICNWLPYLVTLDLSNNQLTGPIPDVLANCTFLNKLVLSDNMLSGYIPSQLASLARLKTLSVANNELSGTIPSDLSFYDSSCFEGNSGLCGVPLRKCPGLSKRRLAVFIAAGVFGAVTVAALLLFVSGVCLFYFSKPSWRRKRGYEVGSDGDGSWTDRLKAHKLIQVYLFQKPLVKVKLADLMAATNDFSVNSIISSTRTGTTYMAVLPDGSSLAIKRLNTCKLRKKQFLTEMNRLGLLRHPNLVPLLGYCMVKGEKLLIYKHMSSGTLNSMLNGNPSELDWPTRFRVSFGAARGLAWLHHGRQPPVLHGNISPNAILLDEGFDARIIDFGLARLVTSDDMNEGSFVNGDLGEFGNMAPEYLLSTTVASLTGDVYCFGVVLLELATGQRPLDLSNADEGFQVYLMDWVSQLSSSGRLKDAIDRSLCGRGHDEEIVQFLRIACRCVVSRPEDRWSMFQVYESLKSIAAEHGFSEQYDEYPLRFGGQDTNNQTKIWSKSLEQYDEYPLLFGRQDTNNQA